MLPGNHLELSVSVRDEFLGGAQEARLRIARTKTQFVSADIQLALTQQLLDQLLDEIGPLAVLPLTNLNRIGLVRISYARVGIRIASGPQVCTHLVDEPVCFDGVDHQIRRSAVLDDDRRGI